MNPCRKCGSAERNKWGQCVACRKAWYRQNSEEVNKKSKEWANTHQATAEETRERSRLKKYGLTVEQHQQLLAEQNGLCRICEEPFGRFIHIDHDHGTGRVRGLLCHKCNVGLGHFRDDPQLLRAAAEYIEQQPTDLVVPPTS